jgi:hypothetical protein
MRTLNRTLLLISALITLAPGAALAGDFMDTRLSFVLSDNNFFAGPGETRDNSPGFGIGADKSSTQFYDNYETRFSGFETMSHLALYKKMPSFFEYLTTEASLVVRFLLLNERATGIYDTGSFVALTYDLSQGTEDKRNLQLVLFPISGDRFRLGYSYRISWGGSGIFLGATMAPAAKLQLNLPGVYAFLGMKTAQINENLFIDDMDVTEMVTNYGLLLGAGMDLEGFRAEANAGYFTRGTLPSQGVRGRGIYTAGGSYQVGYHQGMEIGTSIDFALYRNDPDVETKFFKPEQYDTDLSFVVKHEGTFLGQTLMDPERYGTTVNQLAMAFDVNIALKWKYLRAHLDAMYRSLSYVLLEVPSFTPFQEFPDNAEVTPEYFVALGVDYHFPDLHLTPGLVFGVQMPSTYTTENLTIGSVTFPGKRTVVVRDAASRSPLPQNEGAKIIWAAKVNCKWDLSEMLTIIAEVYYSWDDNQVRFVQDASGIVLPQDPLFIDPKILGMNFAAQARF